MARNPDRETIFRFREFSVKNHRSAMKVGSDSVMLGALAGSSPGFSPSRILDIGTGTGVIALILAQRFDRAKITGVEIDKDASEEASENFTESPYHDRLSIVEADILDYEGDEKFDLIVCNPPYFKETLHSPSAARAQARHDDSLSPMQLMQKASSLLAPGGLLAVIYPSSRDSDVIYAASVSRLYASKMMLIHTVEGKPASRTIWEFRNVESTLEESHLIMRDTANYPTQEYYNLVNKFYITVK